MDQSDWNIVNAVAQSLSAVGTLAAVVVALQLARRQNAIRLNVRVTVVHTVQIGLPGSDEGPFLNVHLANAGLRDATVVGIGWRIGLWKKNYFAQTLPLNALSATLPKKLTPTDSATFLFPWERYALISRDMRLAFGKRDWARSLRARFTRVTVHLSTGETMLLRPRGDGVYALAKVPTAATASSSGSRS
jgi:hypothetical protein